MSVVARLVLIVTLVILVASSAIAAVVQPPAPTGPHAVGTMIRHLVDTNRPEDFTEAADDHRELMLQIWYPAEKVSDREPLPYLNPNPEYRKIIAMALGMSADRANATVGTWKSHSYEGAPASAAPAKFPVILFSHGFGGIRTQNLSQMEELASRGYVVAAVDHTYCAGVVEFPGGRLVGLAAEFQKQDPKADPEVVDKRYDDLARLWAADDSFVIDELTRLNAAKDSPLAGRLDLARIGVFGHSFGGATAGQLCLREPRVKCGINMDGRPYGDARKDGVKQPFMVLTCVRPAEFPPALAAQGMTKESYAHMLDSMNSEIDLIVKSAPAGYRIDLTHMEHYNFTDVPWYGELSMARNLILGDIDPNRGGKIINTYVIDFFDKYLQGKPAASLADGAAKEPEVSLKAFTAK